jgi:hypothetical protein
MIILGVLIYRFFKNVDLPKLSNLCQKLPGNPQSTVAHSTDKHKLGTVYRG